MKKIHIFVFIIVLSSLKIFGQQNFRISFSSDYSFNKSQKGFYMSNSGFRTSFDKLFYLKNKSYFLGTGLSVGVNSVAFFSAIDARLGKNISIGIFDLKIIAGMQQGADWFRPKPLYLFGVYSGVEISKQILKKKRIGFFIQYKYYNIPKYKSYSTVNQFDGLNFGLCFYF